jgi:hypothetical protein
VSLGGLEAEGQLCIDSEEEGGLLYIKFGGRNLCRGFSGLKFFY